MDLTVAICMYNAERFLWQTLESVMAQTRQDFYLLIIDDCSTDTSVSLVKDFFDKNPRQYELIVQKENHGIAFERNFALIHSKSKYILFLDSDDLFDPTLVEKQYNKLDESIGIMGVSCWSRYINEKGRKINGGTFLGDKTPELFINRASRSKLIFLPIHTMFDRNAALSSGGFSTRGFPSGKPRWQDFCEELDLWTRMSDKYVEGKSMIVIPEILYYYRKSDGLSSNHFQMIVKMRYVKTNLRRRRAGLQELTFVEFYNSLSESQLKDMRKEANAADNFRNAVFYLRNRDVFKALSCGIKAGFSKPSYVLDKIRYNLLK